jgi:transposase-like protein
MDFDSKTEFQSDLGALGSADGVVIPPGQSFSITELAEAFGITTRALRFYEDHDLLRPERRGQARVYSRADFARLAWVLRSLKSRKCSTFMMRMMAAPNSGPKRWKNAANVSARLKPSVMTSTR